MDVVPYDDAYAWCRRHRFSDNPVTGGFDVIDIERLAVAGSVVAATRADAGPSIPLFDTIRDRELVKLGVPRELVPTLRLLTNEVQLEGPATLLPPAVRDALTGLASGMGVEEVWYDIQRVHAAPGSAPRLAADDSPAQAHARHALQVAEGDTLAEPASVDTSGLVDDEAGGTALADAALSPSNSSFLHTFTDDAELLAVSQHRLYSSGECSAGRAGARG